LRIVGKCDDDCLVGAAATSIEVLRRCVKVQRGARETEGDHNFIQEFKKDYETL
jgi:hypothetical protein